MSHPREPRWARACARSRRSRGGYAQRSPSPSLMSTALVTAMAGADQAGQAKGVASTLPEELRRLAQRQHGVVCSAQVRASGLSKDTVRSRLRRGRWRQLHHGVYALFTGAADREATLWAAVLRVGRGATLSHETAAERGGLTDRPSQLIHVSIPPSRRVIAVCGLVIHHG